MSKPDQSPAGRAETQRRLEPAAISALGVLAVDIRWLSAKTLAWLNFLR
jgi:hypothetical protein